MAGEQQTQGSAGWWTYLSILREAIASSRFYESWKARPPACPECGEPIRQGPRGQLYCPFDGWRPGGGSR